jgi:hypothetical protein
MNWWHAKGGTMQACSFLSGFGRILPKAAVVAGWLAAGSLFAANTLEVGGVLKKGQCLTSQDGRFKLVLQDDGNLCIRQVTNEKENHVWGSQVTFSGPGKAVLQPDHNLCVYADDSPTAKWTSDSQQRGRFEQGVRTYLIMQNDGNACIYSGDEAIWSARSR